MQVNINPHTSVVLTRFALVHILNQVTGLSEEDKKELQNGLEYCNDQIVLERNLVKTPSNFNN